MISKYRPKRLNKLIPLSEIKEQMVLIDGSDTDFITVSGKVYKDYGNNMFYPKLTHINKYNGYVYVSITFKDGKNRSRRLHILLAKAFIPNPNPQLFKIVGHKDNNKSNNNLDNLYWTTTQENTQKAIDDGLNCPKIAENNNQSFYVKVLDKDTQEIIGVYGSLRECDRCIKNVSLSLIAKMCSKGEIYKPRSRKYIYRYATEKEFRDNMHLKNNYLIENPIVDKNPTIFRMINSKINFDKILDNQTTASKICGISQALISKYIKDNDNVEHDGWKFSLISKTDYKNSSAYQNQINLHEDIIIKNIYTNEIQVYKTNVDLKNNLNIKGHDIQQYIRNNHILMGEWKIINPLTRTK